MANNEIRIIFIGDDKLSDKIKKLDKATKSLINSQAKLVNQGKQNIQQQKISRVATQKSTISQKKLADTQEKASQRTRILGGTFAVLRSKMLLFNFAMGLGIRQLIRFGKESAKLENVTRAFNTLTGSVNTTFNGLHKLQKATDGTVSKIDLLTQANNALILGVTDSVDEMAEMFDIAQRLGRALGQDTATSVESLITGIGRQSKLMLDNIGIVVKSQEAYEDYANKINKTAEELTDSEKKTAFFEATMESARKKVATLGVEVLSTQDAYDQLGVATTHLANQIGSFLSPLVLTLAKGLQISADASREFIRSLTESPLDRTIRELKELGASTESLMKLEKLKLSRNLSQFNFELAKSANFYTDIDKLQKAIEKTDSERIKNATITAGIELKRQKINKEIINLESQAQAIRENRLRIIGSINREYRADVKKALNSELEEDNKTYTTRIENINRMIEKHKERLSVTEEEFMNAMSALEILGVEGEELQKNLELLTGIKFTKEQINALTKETADTTSDEGDKLDTRLQREIAFLEKKKELSHRGLNIEERLVLIQEKRSMLAREEADPESQLTKMEIKKQNIELDIEEIELKEQLKQATISATSGMLGAFSELSKASKGNNVLSARLAQASAIADTYAGVNKAFAQGGVLGFVTGAAVLAQGLANVSIIQQQLNEMQSFETGGLVGGRRHAQGGTIIEAEQGEFVMSRNAVQSIGVETLSAMNKGGGALTVNIQGNILGSEEFVRDTLLPEISKTVNQGLA